MKRFLPGLICMAILLASAPTTQADVLKDHQGHWLGDLKIPNGPTFKTGVEVFTRADGSAWASVSSPDQGNYDMPVGHIHEAGNVAELDLSFASMKLTWSSDHFNAEWRQNGAAFPLELSSVARFPEKSRPQTPRPPFPYTEQTLAIAGADNVTLGATLSIPTNNARPNLVILVHGSGPQTRDEYNEGHRTFAVLADHLARQGVAVLRYDKRGVSRSTGDYAGHTQIQLVDDLAAVVHAMAARKQFHRLGLIGHSEGPMIAAAVAARNPKEVHFLVSLAGVGLPGLDMILLQDRLSAKDKGADPAAVEKLAAYARTYYETVLAQAESEPRVAALKALQEGLSTDTKALIKKFKMNEGTLSIAMAAEPMLRTLLMANPEADWRAVHCPVLALNGSLDHQVPPESLAGIVSALHKGGNQKVESAVLPMLNHMFQTAQTGAEDEYATIDETIAPAVLKRVAAFAAKQR